MNIKPNIGTLNALIRITCGLTVIVWSAVKLIKKPWRDSYLLLVLMGAMKVAEGIVRFCPLTALFEQGQDFMELNNDDDDVQNELLPYNPT